MLAKVTLTVHGGTRHGDSIVVHDNSSCLVGSAPDCDVRLTSSDGYEGVLPHHFRVDVDLPQVRVYELHAALTNGGAGNLRPRRGGLETRLVPIREVNVGEQIAVGNGALKVGILIVGDQFPPSPED